MVLKSKLSTPKTPTNPILPVIRARKNENLSIQQNPPHREILVRNISKLIQHLSTFYSVWKPSEWFCVWFQLFLGSIYFLLSYSTSSGDQTIVVAWFPSEQTDRNIDDFELPEGGELALKGLKIGFGTNGENWPRQLYWYSPDFKENFRECLSAPIELTICVTHFSWFLTIRLRWTGSKTTQNGFWPKRWKLATSIVLI